MIRTVADLLTAFRDNELAAIEPFRVVGHGPMIGDMYEGLSRRILELAIFDGLGLRVVKGKIINAAGKLSDQIDCMLVHGEGRQLPHTEHYIYDIEQVIAVLEVKRNLYAADLSSAYENLLSVGDLAEPRDVRTNPLRIAYRSIVREDLPEISEVEQLPVHKKLIFHVLVNEVLRPVRIVLGYFGYASETSLRQGFVDYLKANVTENRADPRFGYGPGSLPNLVVCHDLGLLKMNGFPYAHPLDDKGEWVIVSSFARQPVTFLLELIWTRLVSQFGISADIFGEDLDTEAAAPLVWAKAVQDGDRTGWQYRIAPVAVEIDDDTETREWSPVFLSFPQEIVLQVILRNGFVDTINDHDFLTFLREQGVEVEQFVQEFIRTGLVWLSSEGKLQPLTDQCSIVTLPDGSAVAGENSTGRLSRWVKRWMQNHRAQQQR